MAELLGSKYRISKDAASLIHILKVLSGTRAGRRQLQSWILECVESRHEEWRGRSLARVSAATIES